MLVPDLDDLAARAEALAVARDGRGLLGIAGAPGAGKTTLARRVVERLGGFPRAVQVPMDGFHLATVELERLGRRDRMGAPDTFDPDGYAALLRRVRGGETVWAPNFERDLEEPLAQAIAIVPDTRIVISEGNYLLLPSPKWQAVRAVFDEVWFCHADEDERVRRLIARHIEFGKSPSAAREWVLRSDQANAALVAPTASDADLIVPIDFG